MPREFVRLIESAHAGQEYRGGVPYKHHVHRVAHLVQWAVRQCAEPADLSALFQAALAHDVLEDTKVSEEQLAKYCSPQVIAWIRALTLSPDEERPPRPKYLAQLASAPEEVRLIKLADVFDNCLTGSRRMKENGTAWTRSFLLPVMDEMVSGAKSWEFVQYSKSGKMLQGWCGYALDVLRLELVRWESGG